MGVAADDDHVSIRLSHAHSRKQVMGKELRGDNIRWVAHVPREDDAVRYRGDRTTREEVGVDTVRYDRDPETRIQRF